MNEEMKKNIIGYAIEMRIGEKYSYVFSPEDIETGGFVDLDNDWLLPTEEEATTLLSDLSDYCREQGYENVFLRIEGFES